MTKQCRVCKIDFPASNWKSAFCSDKCRGNDEGSIPPSRRFAVFSRDNFSCRYCGRDVLEDGIKLEIDHIIPRSRDGSNKFENLVTSCRECNIGKGNK